MTPLRKRLSVLGALLLTGVVFAVWFLHPLATPLSSGRADRGDNGLWMRRHWLHGGDRASTSELVEALRKLGIRRIYPFLGPMDVDGTPGWRDHGVIQRWNPEVAGIFLAEMKQVDPEIRVIPWTGGNLEQDVHLGAEAQRRGFAEQAARIVALGADGIHINVEPMPSDTPGYLDLLGEVKVAIGPDRILSVAAYPPITPLHPFNDVHWTLEFTRQVCMVADELVFMAYDTGLTEPVLYEGLVAWWTRKIAGALPSPDEGGCEWSMGMPAYEDDFPWHRPDVETLETGLAGLLAGLDGDRIPPGFTGAAIYASWTTDMEEWATWDRVWRGREPCGARVPDVTGDRH